MKTKRKYEFKKCCALEIKRLWKLMRGSMNIVRYEGECPKCEHYIGLTQTIEKEANSFFKRIRTNNKINVL